jgi:hypothetical protein
VNLKMGEWQEYESGALGDKTKVTEWEIQKYLYA